MLVSWTLIVPARDVSGKFTNRDFIMGFLFSYYILYYIIFARFFILGFLVILCHSCATLFRALRTAAGRWDAEEGHRDPSQACICLMLADSAV
jgi:uncharacterized membrane protein